MEIRASEGYAADQIKTITVGELKEMLEYYEDEDEIVLHDNSNRYGAAYGRILDIEELEDYEEEEEETEHKTGAVIIDNVVVATMTHKDIS